MVIFNDEFEWEYDWVEAFSKAVLEHANIKATEIYAEEMDEDYITLWVTEQDAASSECIAVQYLLYYVDAVESLHRNLLFFYILYQPEGDYSTVRDYGAYQIERNNGVCYCHPLEA